MGGRLTGVYVGLARLVLALGWLGCALPRHWLYALGGCIGSLLYRVWTRRRQIVRTNLGLCFPGLSDAARLALERQHFRALGIGLVETLAAWSGQGRHLLGRMEWDESVRVQLEAARSRGQGLLLLGMHSTVMELIGSIMLQQWPKLIYMYRHQSQPLADTLMRLGRVRSAGRPGLHRSQLRAALRVLKQNGMLWYAVDQDLGPRHSVYAPFFNVPTATLRYAGRMARCSRALVCLFWCYRLADGSGYRFGLEPLELSATDEVQDARCINAAMERAVQAAPEQYFWVHRRFKTRPAGQASVY